MRTDARAGRLRWAALATLLPLLLTSSIYLFRMHRIRPGGDEPHYLVMADSLLSDRSFELSGAYRRDAETRRFVGPVRPHVIDVSGRQMPYHTPGLSMLIALPLEAGGVAAVRWELCLLSGILLPLALFTWLNGRMPPRDAAWVTVGIVLCTPLLFGATRVFPDLPAGVFATLVALWLPRSQDAERRGAWLLAGLAVAFLPWLNVKYLGTAGVFLLAFVACAVHSARAGRRGRAAWAAGGTIVLLAGPVLLATFNAWAYGNLAGARAVSELTSSFSRGAEIFLGLHFDQSQGLFVRNPLMLAGVLFLPAFARRFPWTAAFWLLLYLSLIMPNALEMARYGGGSPTARFTWSALWLWSVPIGVGLGALPRLRRFVPLAVSLGVAYQAALAVRWIVNPAILYPALAEQLDLRDSLFPVAMRRFFPSFYFWDFSSYWTYGPNLAAYALVALLLACGVFLARGAGSAAAPAECAVTPSIAI